MIRPVSRARPVPRAGTPWGLGSIAFANPVAGGLTTDLVLSSATFWAFAWTRRRDPRRMAVLVACTVAVGLVLALPLFLLSRPTDAPEG